MLEQSSLTYDGLKGLLEKIGILVTLPLLAVYTVSYLVDYPSYLHFLLGFGFAIQLINNSSRATMNLISAKIFNEGKIEPIIYMATVANLILMCVEFGRA